MSEVKPGEAPSPEERVFTDVGLVLGDPSGALVDDAARAHDVTSSSFVAVTRTRPKEGSKISFTLMLPNGQQAKGKAQFIWVHDVGWDLREAGAKITSISWRDSMKLRSAGHEEGYDFVRLAKLVALGVFWIVVVAGAQNVIFYHPHLRRLFVQMIPVMGALSVIAAAVIWLIRGD